ncbi:hypothetical protein Dimus_035817 [Dionaea muscipula]
MTSSSADPGEVSSSEEGDAWEAAVTASEGEDLSDLVDGILGSSPVHDLSPILEDGGKTGASSSSMSGSLVFSPSAAVLVCQASIDAGGRELVSSLSSLLGADVRSRLVDCVDALGVKKFLGGLPTLTDDGANLPPIVFMGQSQFPLHSMDSNKNLCSALELVRSSSAHFSSYAAACVDGRQMHTVEQIVVSPLLQADPLIVGSTMPVADPYCSSVTPLLGNVGMGIGGLVREEARVSPVAREALRTQPTDGLRQPPSSPVVPVSGAEGGVGLDDISGGRSYARVVHADRQTDVELRFRCQSVTSIDFLWTSALRRR